MNFLAHAYLSFGDPETTVGNIISDFVKGRAQNDFPEGIRRGIRLHRDIDRFTDLHPATREAKAHFHHAYRLYSSAFVDIVYDHFLAADAETFTEESLRDFADGTYAQLDLHLQWLPGRFADMFPYMKSQDWLFNYRHLWGIEMSFKGLVRRAAYMDDSSEAMKVLESRHRELQACYRAFMPDVSAFARKRWEELLDE
jgi:acyl carrier protein phosphodiesterase